MPRKCCVPGCFGNYDAQRKASVFSFPIDDPSRVKLWLEKIPRKGLIPNQQTVVCEKHFRDEFIIRFEPIKMADGTVACTMKRKIPKLSEDAVPDIFNIDEQVNTKKSRSRSKKDNQLDEVSKRKKYPTRGRSKYKEKIKTPQVSESVIVMLCNNQSCA